MQFIEGMRVRHKHKEYTGLSGATGTVVHAEQDNDMIGVEWDESKPYMHNCGGRCKDKHGFYILPEELELIEEMIPAQSNGGNTLKLEDLHVAMPLLGLRVMVNPEHFERVNSRMHGLSGTIVNEGGANSSVRDVIRRYKNQGSISDWSVRVMFDNGKSESISIRYLLPIANGHKTMYKVKFTSGDEARWKEEDYKEKINHYVIIHGESVFSTTVYNDEYRQKILDEV